MSIFDALGQKNAAPAQGINPQALAQLRQNPVGVLRQAGLSVPDGMADPQQIINHLLQSGQISNPRLQAAQQMLARLGVR